MSSTTIQDAQRYCRTVTRQQAKNFYFAFLSLPADQRRAIYAVYAFSRQCDDYSDDDMDNNSKLALLEEYRRQLAEAFAGRQSGPVFVALMDAAQRYNIPHQYFDDVISGVQMDLTINRYPTFDDLRTYCYRVASVVGLICLEIFGYSNERAKDAAVDLGIAMQLVNIMRDIKEDASRGRVYLPIEDLRRFGYAEEELFAEVHDERFVELMQFEATRARDFFEKGLGLLPMISARSRACPAILGGLYSAVLDRIERQNWRVFEGRVRLSTRQKLWLAGRIWTGTLTKSLIKLFKS